jgi:hypothetical protein
MVQRGHGARFLFEPPAAFGVSREVGWQRLEATSRLSRVSRAR